MYLVLEKKKIKSVRLENLLLENDTGVDKCSPPMTARLCFFSLPCNFNIVLRLTGTAKLMGKQQNQNNKRRNPYQTVSVCFIIYKQQQPDNGKQYDHGLICVGNFKKTIERAKKTVEFDFHKVA